MPSPALWRRSTSHSTDGNRVTRSTATVLAAVGLLLAGCGGSSESSSTNASPSDSTGATVPSSDEIATTTAPAITAPTTTLPDPTVFNPSDLGRILELSSFVLTRIESHSNNGTLDGRTTTIGYTNAPASAYVEVQYSSGDFSKDYLVDGRTYQKNHQNYWYLYENGSLAAPDILYDVEYPQALSYLSVGTAVFIGEEDYAGVAAYHFTFDETNLQGYSSYTPEHPGPEAEGDFYVAKDGNYVLYAHSRQVSAGPGYELIDEFTDTLSSVNGVTTIALPDDMLPLKDALDLGVALGVPMPADGQLDSMINYNSGGIGVYYYQFTSTWKNEAEFLAFYTNLQPTNGWTVTHIGQIENLDVYCGDGNCVIVKNGDKQVILYFDGSNLHADFDREHRFGPCTQPYSPTACG